MKKSEYVTTSQAARMLNLSTSRLYHIKHWLTHKKAGDKQQGRLLFRADTLLDDYLSFTHKFLV